MNDIHFTPGNPLGVRAGLNNLLLRCGVDVGRSQA